MNQPAMPIPNRIATMPSWLDAPNSPTRPTSTSSAIKHDLKTRKSGAASSPFDDCNSTRVDDSDEFWQTSPRVRPWKLYGNEFWLKGRGWRLPKRRSLLVLMAFLLVVAIACTFRRTSLAGDYSQDVRAISIYEPIRPLLPLTSIRHPDPIDWLSQNSDLDRKDSSSHFPFGRLFDSRERPKAALISLVRNSELPGIVQSMSQLEYRWNHKYNYPWVFFNDEPFTEQFKASTRNLTTANVYYEMIPKEHWSIPEWIDESRFLHSLEYLATIGVGKGWMVSYHHMCRWNSGFFYKHPRLKDFEWYWRVEPNVHFFCDINYDVFNFMSVNHLGYGFNMAILDDARSFPSLWARTHDFILAHPDIIHPEADLSWLLSPPDSDYNNCQFFSNFEVGSLTFWRSRPVQMYFDWLDKSGGFYYERWGDAPVHTLAVAMFMPKRQTWFFRDIGYQHDINSLCPPGREGMCACQKTAFDDNFYKLVPKESRQKKPNDTCLRLWLGGEWLEKRPGWNIDIERSFGGDGYGGYVKLE